VQIIAIEIAIDHLHGIGPPEAVLPSEMFIRKIVYLAGVFSFKISF
jgi:hypothetical protein